MTISIDIDGTWDLDVEGWNLAMFLLTKRHHKIIFITGAVQPAEKLKALQINPLHVLTCQPGEFKEACAARHGIKVDVWIDNEPGTIQPQKKLAPCNDTEL